MVLTHILWTMVGKTSLTLPLTKAQQGLMRAYPWHGQISLFLSCNKTVPCWTDFVILLVHLTKWHANLQPTPKTFYILPILTSGGLGLKVHINDMVKTHSKPQSSKLIFCRNYNSPFSKVLTWQTQLPTTQYSNQDLNMVIYWTNSLILKITLGEIILI